MGTFLLLLLLLHTCKTTTGSDVGDVRSSSAGCCWPVPAADGCFSGGKVSVATGWTNPTLCWPTVRTGPWIINESETTNISGHICDWNEELRKEKVWINNWLENTLVDWFIHKRKCLFFEMCSNELLRCCAGVSLSGWVKSSRMIYIARPFTFQGWNIIKIENFLTCLMYKDDCSNIDLDEPTIFSLELSISQYGKWLKRTNIASCLYLNESGIVWWKRPWFIGK